MSYKHQKMGALFFLFYVIIANLCHILLLSLYCVIVESRCFID